MSLGGKAGYVAHPPYDLRRQNRPDPEHTTGQAGGGLFERLPDAALEIFELPVKTPDISEQIRGQPSRGTCGTAGRAHAAPRRAARERPSPPRGSSELRPGVGL